MSQQEFLTNINKIENLLFAFALKLTRSQQDAQDLMQETTMKAFRHRNKFKAGTNFKSWSSTIMRNTFINNYRKKKSRKHVNNSIDDFSFAIENDNTIPNEGEHNLRLEELYGMLGQIGEIYRVPFTMFCNGYEYKEIADHLQIPIGTVKSRIFLARKKMKAQIASRSIAA
ncbi:MAG: RNA polymerase sigma factor [Bacteroidota bacterium]